MNNESSKFTDRTQAWYADEENPELECTYFPVMGNHYFHRDELGLMWSTHYKMAG
jgi:hypothetical protein